MHIIKSGSSSKQLKHGKLRSRISELANKYEHRATSAGYPTIYLLRAMKLKRAKLWRISILSQFCRFVVQCFQLPDDRGIIKGKWYGASGSRKRKENSKESEKHREKSISKHFVCMCIAVFYLNRTNNYKPMHKCHGILEKMNENCPWQPNENLSLW